VRTESTHYGLSPFYAPHVPDKPDDDIFARLTGFYSLRLGVHTDHEIGCVAVDIAGIRDGFAALLAPPHALELAHRLIEAGIRLRRAEIGPGPFRATF
jgi:hypothetical protein